MIKLKYILTLQYLFSVFLFTLGANDDVGSLKNIFSENKGQILKSQSVEISGVIFIVGKATSKATSRTFGFSKARTSAYGKTHLALLNRVKWPNSIQNNLREKILKDYFNLVGSSVIVKRTQKVYSHRSNNLYTVVLALKFSDVQISAPTFKLIKDTLLAERNHLKPMVRMSVVLELAEANYTPAMLQAYSQRLSKEYGENVGCVVRGVFADRFSLDIAHKLPRLKLEDCSLQELFQLLNQVPYHPQLCWEIANRLEHAGMNYNAKLFKARGGVIPELAQKFASKCQKGKPNEIFSQKPATTVDFKHFESFMSKVVFTEPNLKLFARIAGRVPAGNKETPTDKYYESGRREYSANNIGKAYSEFKKSVILNLSFDGCNMAGNVARRLNKPYDAIPFLLQALAIDGQKDYPWIHLGHAFIQLQNVGMLVYCIENAERCKQTSSWSQNQIRILKQKLEKMRKEE